MQQEHTSDESQGDSESGDSNLSAHIEAHNTSIRPENQRPKTGSDEEDDDEEYNSQTGSHSQDEDNHINDWYEEGKDDDATPGEPVQNRMSQKVNGNGNNGQQANKQHPKNRNRGDQRHDEHSDEESKSEDEDSQSSDQYNSDEDDMEDLVNANNKYQEEQEQSYIQQRRNQENVRRGKNGERIENSKQIARKNGPQNIGMGKRKPENDVSSDEEEEQNQTFMQKLAGFLFFGCAGSKR